MRTRHRLLILGGATLLVAVTAWRSRPALAARNPFDLPVVLEARGTVRGEVRLPLKGSREGGPYSLSVAVESPAELAPEGRLRVTVRQGAREVLAKTLHVGDPDLYTLVRWGAEGVPEVRLSLAGAARVKYHVAVHQWPATASLEAEPNNSLAEANPIELGTTVFGSGDEEPYIAAEGAAADAGEDWFRFEFREARPKLVFFGLDLMERDNLPVDVAVFRAQDGEAVAFENGADPVTPPHEVQAIPGNKFTTRVLREPGTYYVRVRARHPMYKLRTRVYDVPPYDDPRQAVQTAVDYIIRAGDSWHANTPRKGGRLDRVANVHQETSLCVACHPTHFSQRAQLYALRNGYAVTGRQQLQFLAERFYNNPRPFYGYEEQGATWARVISAPANVLGRMAGLLQVYEKEVTGEHREKFFRGVAEYLKLYYKDKDTLPPDESNGNLPLVSAYEVAWYAWEAVPELRGQLERLIAQDQHKNLVDLCYQTIALAEIDPEKYREPLRRNGERILSLQRPSGQWAMSFEAAAPEAEFQTGHALWALAKAGYRADDPRVAKGLRYLLGRQQEFGGWFDPLQSYENFRTPFRETQMAVLALSEFYKGPGAKGQPGRVAGTDPAAWLKRLDATWEAAGAAEIRQAARSNEALVRQQAAEALGRLAEASSAPVLRALLGDDNKMVQRTAAWGLRQIVARRGEGAGEVEQALGDRDERTRWGATRVFATHFSYLVDRVRLEPLVRLLDDPLPTIRMQAVQGLWQWWFWDARRASRDRIENAVLAAMGATQHPWVARNLREAVYNLADENVRYLYNNWVPLLADDGIRDRTVRGRLAGAAALAGKFARVLETGTERQKKLLLAGLDDFHLRRADAYGPAPAGTKPGVLQYNRIGNDIEQIVFLGESAARMSRALLPLVGSPDPEMRRLATQAAYLVREIRVRPSYGGTRRYGWEDVIRLAGPAEPGRTELALAVLERLEDSDPAIRAMAAEIYGEFTPDFRRQGTEQVLVRLLRSERPESRRAALSLIYQAPALDPGSPLQPLVREIVLEAKQGAPAVAALEPWGELLNDPQVREAVRRAVESDDVPLARAGVELLLRHPEGSENAALRPALEKALGATDLKRRRAWLDIVEAQRPLADTPRGLEIIRASLLQGDPDLAVAAINLLRDEERLQEVPAIRAALDEARGNPKLEGVVRSRLKTLAAPAPPALDYAFFRARVQPLLAARGGDGNACVYCHDTHTIFHLQRPGPGGFSEEQMRANYQAALKVVDAQVPERSLLLRKPTSDAAVEGTVGARTLSHGGGVRWPAGSREYQTILEWIRGASLRGRD